MFTTLFGLFRGSIGFALLVGGVGFLLSPLRDKPQRCMGIVFAAVGFLFCISALNLRGRLPELLYDSLVIAAILTFSQAYFELSLYLFGEGDQKALARCVLFAGIVWSLLLCLFPFLDYFFRLSETRSSLEGGEGMRPLHTAASIAIYAWPVAVSLISAKKNRLSFHEIPARAPGTKAIIYSSLALDLVLCLIAIGAVLPSAKLYRAGHAALEILTLFMYLFTVARPGTFRRARREICEAKEKQLKLSDEEARFILERIARAAENSAILCRAGLSLRGLAAIVRIPPYRLSICFNTRLKTTFPAWLNALRIERARRLILERPERSILAVAIEVGYTSRAVFNNQFLRIVGMTPSEYRRYTAAAGSPSGNARI